MPRASWKVRLGALAGGLGLLAAAAPAVAQQAPAQVAAKIAQLDQACQRAGGRPVAKPYVLVHDFTGDQRPDFLVSEGDYECAGKPGLFRANNQAFIEIYVTDPRNNAQRAYRQQVRAYRVLNTTPRTVQIALAAPACPGGQNLCGFTLAFNSQTAAFVAQAVGQGATSPAAAAPPAAAPAPAAAGTGTRETQADYLARCQREMIAADPNSRKWAADTCKEQWGVIAASGPAAEALIAVASARAAGPLTPPQVKAALPAVRWSAKPGPGGNVTGALGKLEAVIDAKAGEIGFNWAAVGQPVAFDVYEALKVRGVALTLVACQAFGLSEQTQIYRMAVPGQAPAGLTIARREAPTASATSYYGASLDFVRPPPTLSAIRAKAPQDGWQATCAAN